MARDLGNTSDWKVLVEVEHFGDRRVYMRNMETGEEVDLPVTSVNVHSGVDELPTATIEMHVDGVKVYRDAQVKGYIERSNADTQGDDDDGA